MTGAIAIATSCPEAGVVVSVATVFLAVGVEFSQGVHAARVP
jgi:hypothetical protein